MRPLVALAAVAAIGCAGAPDTSNDTGAAPPVAATGGGGHEHAAPHGGTLVELGNEFAHLERVVDAATGRLTVYSLDGEAEGAVALTQGSIAVTLVVAPSTDTVRVALAGQANALSGETAGSTSVFAAEVPALKGATAVAGTVIQVATRGQTFDRVPFSIPDPH